MYTEAIEPRTTASPIGRIAKKPAVETPRTPESELMSVEEYFDIVWQRYLEKHEKLQG